VVAVRVSVKNNNIIMGLLEEMVVVVSVRWLCLTNHNVFSLVLSARPKGGLWRVTHEWRPRYQGYVLSLLH